MIYSPRLFALLCLLLAAFLPHHVLSQPASTFDACKVRLDRILNGTEIFQGISNNTVGKYIYNGTIGGMKPEYAQKSRDKFIAITTEGCKAICGDQIDWYWASDPSSTLGIISNWVLPIIALLAALPYDSGQGSGWWRNVGRTLLNLRNWLGSPQTALTATFFNIHQMQKCRAASRNATPYGFQSQEIEAGAYRAEAARAKTLKTDAYYVLCCIGQFELPSSNLDCFLETLIYGLFKPVCNPFHNEAEHNTTAKRWTEELLRAMAHQMRRSRRLGVWATSASILLFFVAYAVSVVLAFGDLGERTTTHSLAFGILITWFPLLLFFSILDRNPNSAERTEKFIGRWMWNVRAVKKWEEGRTSEEGQQSTEPRPPPDWWSPARQKGSRAPDTTITIHATPSTCEHPNCVPSNFIGQGRNIGYHSLAYSVVKSLNPNQLSHETHPISLITTNTIENLNKKPPLSWILCALAGLAMVWWEIGMALTISYNIPTVGIGCRSGSYIIYGILSTVPWFTHLFEHLGPQGLWGRRFSKVFNWVSTFFLTLSVPWLVFITFAAFSGILKNCTCRGGLNGYMDFESAEFYRDPEHFDVRVWWIVAAVTAAVPVVLSFVIALPFWVLLKELWREEEIADAGGGDVEGESGEGFPLLQVEARRSGESRVIKADMDWVAY